MKPTLSILIVLLGISMQTAAINCMTNFIPYFKLTAEADIIICAKFNEATKTNLVSHVLKGTTDREEFVSGMFQEFKENKIVASYFFIDHKYTLTGTNSWINFTDIKQAIQFEKRIQQLLNIQQISDEAAQKNWIIEGLAPQNSNFDLTPYWVIIHNQQELDGLWIYDAIVSLLSTDDNHFTTLQKEHVIDIISNIPNPDLEFLSLGIHFKSEKVYQHILNTLYQRHLTKSNAGAIESLEGLLLNTSLPQNLEKLYACLLIYHLKNHYPKTKQAYPIFIVGYSASLQTKIKERLAYVNKHLEAKSLDHLISKWEADCDENFPNSEQSNTELEKVINEAARLLNMCEDDRIESLLKDDELWKCSK